MNKYKSTIVRIIFVLLLLVGMYLIGKRMQGAQEAENAMDKEANEYFNSIDTVKTQ